MEKKGLKYIWIMIKIVVRKSNFGKDILSLNYLMVFSKDICTHVDVINIF